MMTNEIKYCPPVVIGDDGDGWEALAGTMIVEYAVSDFEDEDFKGDISNEDDFFRLLYNTKPKYHFTDNTRVISVEHLYRWAIENGYPS